MYADVVREVITIYDNLALPDLAAKMYDQIRDYVRAEDRKEVTNEQFESAYQTLLSNLAERTQVMESNLTSAGL